LSLAVTLTMAWVGPALILFRWGGLLIPFFLFRGLATSQARGENQAQRGSHPFGCMLHMKELSASRLILNGE
jgi:hypothetical protein